jgi:hypothetical protein
LVALKVVGACLQAAGAQGAGLAIDLDEHIGVCAGAPVVKVRRDKCVSVGRQANSISTRRLHQDMDLEEHIGVCAGTPVCASRTADSISISTSRI